MSTGNPYGVTAEDLRRLERRRESLERALEQKKRIRDREIAYYDDMITRIEEDIADTVAELGEKTEEWENQHGGH